MPGTYRYSDMVPVPRSVARRRIEALRVHAPVADRVAALTDEGVAVEDIGLRRPSLDDVFLQLTGRAA